MGRLTAVGARRSIGPRLLTGRLGSPLKSFSRRHPGRRHWQGKVELGKRLLCITGLSVGTAHLGGACQAMEFNIAANALRSLLTLPAGTLAGLGADELGAPQLRLAGELQASRARLRTLPDSSACMHGPAAASDFEEARDPLAALESSSFMSLMEARRLEPADPLLRQEYDSLVVWQSRRLMEGPADDPRMDLDAMNRDDPPLPPGIVVSFRRRFMRLRRRRGSPYARLGRTIVIA